MAQVYQKYRDAPEAFPGVQQYEGWLLSIPMRGLRYIEPLYLPPNAPVFRGINARKGDNLLDEALFDLLKRGAGAAELTKVKATEATWAKLGQLFTSLQLSYVTEGYFNDGGALMVIKPEWVNEQVRIRQARNQAEAGAFHYVFYQTIPLEAFSEIHVSGEVYAKVHALSRMPQFTKKELRKAGIKLPTSPAEERDLFLLYKAIRENGKSMLAKLKAYKKAEDIEKVVPRGASFKDAVVPENVRRFIGRKLAKQWLDKGLQSSRGSRL